MRSLLRDAFALRSTRICLMLATAAAFGMCALPLLGVQGAESALVLGVLLPPMAAVLGARVTCAARVSGGAHATAALLEATLVPALGLFALPCLVLAADALRVRNCSPLEGLAFMLLGPGFGVLLACLIGVSCALLLRSSRAATTAAAAVPVLGMLLAITRFYASPGIFAYGHFFGYFPGTLYDEGTSIGGPLISLRVLSSVWVAALCLLISSSIEPKTLRPARATIRTHRFAFACALALCALGVLGEACAVELGHVSSAEHMREALGGELQSKRCALVFPREWSRGDRQRLAADCDFRVVQAERWLGLTHPSRIKVFLFRSPDEKAALMGAAGTNIAKPWRSEVYISENGWPNPVLGHELVHIVAAGAGVGPFRIAGQLGGLLPDPSLIEGVAVAAAWQTQAGLTPHQWSRAMLELGMLPKLSELFGAGFLAQQKRLAYTLSGSLLRFVAERHGTAAVRRAYTSADLAAAVGVPLPELEAAWHAYLRSLPLSPRVLALTRARFAGSSIFATVCPHALAKLQDALRGDLAAGDDLSALQECTQILDIDRNEAGTRAALVAVLARLGEDARAQHELRALIGPPSAPRPFITLAQQALADEALRRGDRAKAEQLYTALLAEPSDDDTLRMLQVKALALRGTPNQARLLFELLVGQPGERSDGATAVHLARELRNERSDGLPQYLEARQLFFQKRFARAAQLLQDANERGLPTPELAFEANRVRAVCLFASGNLERASNVFEELASSPEPGRAADANDWLSRIQFTEAQAHR